jgi:hypothetical protein
VTNTAMQDNSNISFRTLVIVRSPCCGPPPLLDAGGFNAPQAYSTPPACSKGGAQVLGSCCCDCQAVAASSLRLLLFSQLQPYIPLGQLCER